MPVSATPATASVTPTASLVDRGAAPDAQQRLAVPVGARRAAARAPSRASAAGCARAGRRSTAAGTLVERRRGARSAMHRLGHARRTAAIAAVAVELAAGRDQVGRVGREPRLDRRAPRRSACVARARARQRIGARRARTGARARSPARPRARRHWLMKVRPAGPAGRACRSSRRRAAAPAQPAAARPSRPSTRIATPARQRGRAPGGAAKKAHKPEAVARGRRASGRGGTAPRASGASACGSGMRTGQTSSQRPQKVDALGSGQALLDADELRRQHRAHRARDRPSRRRGRRSAR